MLDTGPTFDPRALRDAFGQFATGVTVVTVADGQGRPTGVTVGSFTSLSLEPALCLFSLARTQTSCRWIEEADAFNISVLARDGEAVAWQCARPAPDKLAGIDWTPGRNGLPLIEGALARFECARWAIHDGGDHVIVVGRILHFDRAEEGAPLVFHRGSMTTLAE